MRRSDLAVLGFTTLLAGVLRFATLDVQSFWFDESVTAGLLKLNVPDLLAELPKSESTPPLYYLLARAWAVPFGDGEIGLRSLSALCGTAAVPAVWAAARELCGARAAHAAATLAAVSPLLVWYSQEARSYGLLTLLSALSLWLFARVLRGGAARDRWLWTLAGGAALATHYFAVFLIAAEAVVLLVRAPQGRSLAAPLLAVSLVGLGLLPLALEQEGAGYASTIAEHSLARRALQAAKQLPLGFDGPLEVLLGALGILIAVGAVALAVRGDGEPARGARVALLLAATVIVSPFVLAAGGVDYVLTRNLLPAWPALAVVVGAGLTSSAARRLGLGAGAVLAMAMLVTTVGVALERDWQREDWRGAVHAIGPPGKARAVIVSGSRSAVPLRLYRPSLRPVSARAVQVDEVVLVGQPGSGGPDPAAVRSLRLRVVERRHAPSYELVRLRPVRAPVAVAPAQLFSVRLDPRDSTALLVERAARGRASRTTGSLPTVGRPCSPGDWGSASRSCPTGTCSTGNGGRAGAGCSAVSRRSGRDVQTRNEAAAALASLRTLLAELGLESMQAKTRIVHPEERGSSSILCDSGVDTSPGRAGAGLGRPLGRSLRLSITRRRRAWQRGAGRRKSAYSLEERRQARRRGSSSER